jgi:GT2 family glycosyltransferase
MKSDNAIAILLPTFGRHTRLTTIKENIDATTWNPHKIYFIVEDSDPASVNEVMKRGLTGIILHNGSYREAINQAYLQTKEPFLFLGSDDITFTNNWDRIMLKKMENPKVGVVGGVDDWPISKTRKHGSHLLIRRSYIEKKSGVFDEKNVIYSSVYQHFMTDIETEQTAMKRGAYAQSDAWIGHPHTCRGTAPNDATYDRELPKFKADYEAYNNRKGHFEQYLIDDLQRGIVTPVNHKKLSVVIESYNVTDYLLRTIKSLYDNTHNDFELIIVDDASTDPSTIEAINSLTQKNIKRIFLKKQGYFTNTVNVGVKASKGEYVVACNNDIDFSRNWDVALIQQFQDPKVFIVSPYQTDAIHLVPFDKIAGTGNVGLRGPCFMLNKEAIDAMFPMPKSLRMWCSDNWLVWKAEQLGKKSVFAKDAVIYHYGSKASQSFHNSGGKFWNIVLEDAIEYESLTGENMKWLKELIKANLVSLGQ